MYAARWVRIQRRYGRYEALLARETETRHQKPSTPSLGDAEAAPHYGMKKKRMDVRQSAQMDTQSKRCISSIPSCICLPLSGKQPLVRMKATAGNRRWSFAPRVLGVDGACSAPTQTWATFQAPPTERY
jgi:hypothetical protein